MMAPKTNDQGRCQCGPWPTNGISTEGSIRHFLDDLINLLRDDYQDRQSEATKQLEKDIQDCEKEYGGFADLIKAYEGFYSQLDCLLTEVKSHEKDIKEWYQGKISEGIIGEINKIWEERYEENEEELESDWIEARNTYHLLQDCLKQAEWKENEAGGDFENTKGFEKSVRDRFANLTSLHGKAKGFKDMGRFEAVYATSLKFKKIYERLGELKLWNSSALGQKSNELKERNPAWFRNSLNDTLRKLILAKYQKFRWHQEWLDRNKDRINKKEYFETFKKTRQDRFVQEAEDTEEPLSNSTGDGQKKELQTGKRG